MLRKHPFRAAFRLAIHPCSNVCRARWIHRNLAFCLRHTSQYTCDHLPKWKSLSRAFCLLATLLRTCGHQTRCRLPYHGCYCWKIPLCKLNHRPIWRFRFRAFCQTRSFLQTLLSQATFLLRNRTAGLLSSHRCTWLHPCVHKFLDRGLYHSTIHRKSSHHQREWVDHNRWPGHSSNSLHTCFRLAILGCLFPLLDLHESTALSILPGCRVRRVLL